MEPFKYRSNDASQQELWNADSGALDIRTFRIGEVRLFKVERRNKNTLLPIIRNNVSAGSMVWSDEWAPYRSTGVEFTSIDDVHTQNIERVLSSLKHHILRSMKNTSKELLESHLHEFMWRSRSQRNIYDTFTKLIREAANQRPIEF
ncbi:hypothetical protein RF11_09998 [Thelohanellus kitauei]|uniref:ISXO2-like transposase domain-containing protein n=1 Tax=Thelohanellus kitauei TaxID=669202 RepID=A0A0C2IZL7_THEKT|nr:hypothetical protein RF11_09998 [Thelohanellus kitauei]